MDAPRRLRKKRPKNDHTLPISLYLNPLKYGDNLAYLEYFPLFANYLTDWAKCGLKNYPIEVSYDHYDSMWGSSYSEKGWFNTRGQLIRTRNSALGKGNDDTIEETRTISDY